MPILIVIAIFNVVMLVGAVFAVETEPPDEPESKPWWNEDGRPE